MAVACRQEGIGRRTLLEWRQRGRLGIEPFAGLVRELDIALAHAESRVVQTVVAAAADDWKAGAWWLERRYPNRYQMKQHLKVEKTPAEMSDAELDAAIAAHGYVRASPTMIDPLPDAMPPNRE